MKNILVGVQRSIDEKIQAGTNSSQILELISSLSEENSVKDLLKDILKDKNLLSHIAQRSYEHVNGFDKIVLFESLKLNYKLRLHIWWPHNPRAEQKEHIHNHRWDFWSGIIIGSLSVETFSFSKDGQVGVHYKSFPGKHGLYVFKRQGNAYIVPLMQSILPAHAYYESKSELLHRVSRPKKELAATLMIQGAFTRPDSDVLIPPDEAHREIEQRTLFSPADLKERLEKFVSMLEDKS